MGWDATLAEAFSHYTGPYIPGRIACRQKTTYEIFIHHDSIQAGISGAMHRAGKVPAVGDFVVLLNQPEAGTSVIVDILPRKTIFSRGLPGKAGADQVIATNIDTIFIVTSAGPDLNARRLERFITLVHSSGAHPVIVINKADLADDPASLAQHFDQVIHRAPVLIMSALTRTGMNQLDPYLIPGSTIALIGSSGVGKSTLINTLLEGSVQETTETRPYDGKGRHKTTVRQMFVLKNGALMIDNPGLREVGIGTAGSGLAETFPDIVALAEGCRFSNCSHEHEPGCGVRMAVQNGKISEERLKNYLQLSRECAFEHEKADIGLVRFERKRWKQFKGTGKLARDLRNLKGQ